MNYVDKNEKPPRKETKKKREIQFEKEMMTCKHKSGRDQRGFKTQPLKKRKARESHIFSDI